MDNNKFMKILIGCGVTLEQLKDYEWFIDEINKHEIDRRKYHCIGFHPVLARIDIISDFFIV